jgi:hypothetical protein
MTGKTSKPKVTKRLLCDGTPAGTTITVLKGNPHRPGTRSYQRYALLKNGITVGVWRKRAIRDGLVKDGWGYLSGYINQGRVVLNLSSGREATARLEQALG